MTQLNLVQTKENSITCDNEWQIEMKTDTESQEKLITLWLLNPGRERYHFLTICNQCLPSLIRALHEADAELNRTA